MVSTDEKRLLRKIIEAEVPQEIDAYLIMEDELFERIGNGENVLSSKPKVQGAFFSF